MQVATPEAYDDDPALVQRFYDERRAALSRVEPNAAHLALARLEEALGDDLLVVTQNVDDLHERAGSTRVHHLHGRLRSAWCTSCDERHEWDGPAGRPAAVPRLRRTRAAARHRVVRRDPLRHGPRRARPVVVRPVRLHRHVGRRLPGGRVRALGAAGGPSSSTWSRARARATSPSPVRGRRPSSCRAGSTRSSGTADRTRPEAAAGSAGARSCRARAATRPRRCRRGAA